MIAVEFTSTDMLMTVAIVLLISLSVAIAVAETAVTRISKTRAMALQAEGNKRADKVLYVINNFERSLNAVYLVALGCQTVQAALTGIVASNVFGPWGVAVATVINVLVVFIIAEAAPKTWALQHTDRAALLTAPLVILLSRVFRHIANVLIWVTNLILPGKGLEQGPFVTEEEIIALMGEAAEAAVIEEEERDLIESIIDFGDTVAREIMVPRTDMVTFEAEYRVADCVEIAILNGLSRFPVYRENVDEIIGIVYSKDIMRAERDHHGADPVEAFVREAYFVPETKRVAELLREMQARKTHIAVVIDEYGGTAGLITLEDLLEELVGEITDEFDTEVDWAEQLSSGAVVVHDASSNVDDINDRFDISLPEGDWDSVGGLVFSELGRVPDVGDSIEVDGYRLTVEGMDGRRVERVMIEPYEAAEEVVEES
ncbi:MAG: hemolysin family protein [Microthrixaceae bacterium]|nr:HlyC/CorC family transporter [Microthrixaceae bacterium]MCO5313080.1 hemolysin family protein [Microthrixaceae bacterium]